jgi:putative hydrolase of the HAD superfamily
VAAAAAAIGQWAAEYPIVLLDGVEETLEQLSRRFRLLLLTKGDPHVQEDKLDRSGLRHFFEEIHVVREKDTSVFQWLISRYELAPERTWMVGNSPRSDINPAVEAGIGAVYVPHPNTWTLEVEEVAEPEKVVVLRSFRELLQAFPTE